MSSLTFLTKNGYKIYTPTIANNTATITLSIKDYNQLQKTQDKSNRIQLYNKDYYERTKKKKALPSTANGLTIIRPSNKKTRLEFITISE